MEHGSDKKLRLYDNNSEYALTTAEMFHNLIINVSVKNENTLNIKTKTCVTSFRLITGLKAPGHVTSPGEHKNADRLDWHLPERYFKNTTVHYLYMGVTIVRANVRSCRCIPFETDGQIQLHCYAF